MSDNDPKIDLQESDKNTVDPDLEKQIAEYELSEAGQKDPVVQRRLQQKMALLRTVEECLAGLQPTHQLAITRLQPRWCARWIETIPIEMDDNGEHGIDLEFLRDTYGGDKLCLRFLDDRGKFMFQKTVNFKGIPPRENGIALEDPEIKKIKHEKELERMKHWEMETKGNSEMMRILIEMMRATNTTPKNDLSEKLFDYIQQANTEKMNLLLAKQEKDNPDPLQQMNNMFALMNTFKENMGIQDQQNEEPDDMNKMIHGFMDLMKQAQENRSREAQGSGQRPQKVKLTPLPGGQVGTVHTPVYGPKQEPPGPTGPVAQQGSSNIGQRSNSRDQQNAVATETLQEYDLDSDQNEPLPSLVEELVDLDTNELANVVCEVLGVLGDEKTKEVFDAIDKIGQGVPVDE